ncbi:MAG: PEP-CTERM sorting domain-containing protein [Sedimentisphaerales bacterium]
MRSTILISMGISVFLAVSSVAMGNDLLPPPWRGQDGSTFQNWQFDNDNNPAAPGIINNQYGSASATIVIGEGGAGWLDQLSGMGTQSGYWDLGGSGGQISINIDNRPVALPYKDIWVQVTYYKDISQAPIVDIPGATFIDGSSGILVEDTGMGSGWFLDQSIWRIEPNPASENIILTSDAAWGSIIDQIVADTICIPEPTSMCLLGLGVLGLLKRRRA